MGDAGQLVSDVAGTLVDAYGLQPVEVTPIPVDTKRVYYLVTDCSGRQWFVKVYRDRTVLPREREAVGLAEFARVGGVPVPGVHRTRKGELVEDTGRLPMSLWQSSGTLAEGGGRNRRGTGRGGE